MSKHVCNDKCGDPSKPHWFPDWEAADAAWCRLHQGEPADRRVSWKDGYVQAYNDIDMEETQRLLAECRSERAGLQRKLAMARGEVQALQRECNDLDDALTAARSASDENGDT